jgi:hypothetical protein
MDQLIKIREKLDSGHQVEIADIWWLIGQLEAWRQIVTELSDKIADRDAEPSRWVGNA